MISLYKRLPVLLQNVACNIYGYRKRSIRYGKWFDYWMKELEETEFFSKKKIKEYQEEKLTGIIEKAYENVPYYKKMLDSHGLKPTSIQSIEDLKKMPILTKEKINLQRDNFLNINFKKGNLIKSCTSGTTGSSLQFFVTQEALSMQWALWWRHRSRFGFNFGDRHLNFTGRPVVASNQTRPPYWRWNYAFNQALISMQTINKKHIEDIVHFVNKENFKYWIGYPSIIHNFCTLVIEYDLQLSCKPDAIFLGAENIYNYQKQDIKQVTGATITDQYGFMEGAANASQCEFHNHHVDFEFGIMECHEPEILDNGNRRGKIVCTGFTNKAFPFIRYEVGDIGIWESEDYECPCGRKSPVLKRIEGRLEDYILTPEGKKMMRFSYLFKKTPQIKEAQVVQKKLGQITVRIVRRNGYSVKTEDKISQIVAEYISPELDVEFEYLTEVPREENGKFRAVKSELNK